MDLTNAYLTIGILAGLWALALTVSIALGSLQGRVRPDCRQTIGLALRVARISFLTLAVLLMLGVLVALGGVVSIGLLAVIAPMVAIQHIRARRETILGLLATSLDRGIPVEATLAAFAGQLGSASEARSKRLSDRLRAGEPLVDALGATPGLIPSDALPLLAVSVQSGWLSARPSADAESAQGRLLESLLPAHSIMGAQERLESTRHALAGKALYALGVLAVVVHIMTVMTWRAIPSFMAIFADLEVALSPATQLLFAVSDFANFYAAPIQLLLFAFFVYAVLRLGYGVPWDLPGMGRLLRPLDAANVFEAMSVGVECGRPLPETLGILVQTWPKRRVRRRLRAVHNEVEQGADWIDSLLANRIVRHADAAVLRSAATVGNLPWAMRAMADSSRRRFAYRTTVALQVAFPLAILALAVVVSLFAVALVMPLVSIPMSLV